MAYGIVKDWRDYPPGNEKRQLYYASREWAILKEAVRKRSRGVCEWCRNAPGTQTHHQTYERLYCEQLDDLLHVCAPCHEFLSGKRGRDPRLDAPVELMGRRIKSVYLAGKITGTSWRDQIAPGWSVQNDGICRDYSILEDGEWETTPGCMRIPDGRQLDLTGPYWRALHDTGGHSQFNRDTGGEHAFANAKWDHDVATIFVERGNLLNEVRSAIERSDLVFAWIDSLDCFGTLFEIGFAVGLRHEDLMRGRRPTIVIAMPQRLDDNGRHTLDQLWLTFESADHLIYADSPGEAWNKLWLEPPTKPKYPTCRVAREIRCCCRCGSFYEGVRADTAEVNYLCSDCLPACCESCGEEFDPFDDDGPCGGHAEATQCVRCQRIECGCSGCLGMLIAEANEPDRHHNDNYFQGDDGTDEAISREGGDPQ
jgi:hypothetical protein